MTSLRRRLTDDRGAVGNIEVLPFSILVFVVGTLLVVNAWGVVDARMTVSSAAREATRVYAESSDPGTADARARRAAGDAVAGHGRDPSRLALQIQTSGFARCAVVTVRAGYEVPALHLPWIGGYGHAFDVWSTHTERIDPYRSGLAGETAC